MSTGGTEKKRNNVGSGEEGETMEIQENSHFDDLRELTNRAIEDPEGTPDRYSIVELSPEVNYKVMTKERTRLLGRLKSNPDISLLLNFPREIRNTERWGMNLFKQIYRVEELSKKDQAAGKLPGLSTGAT